jgi:hypothetical protein
MAAQGKLGLDVKAALLTAAVLTVLASLVGESGFSIGTALIVVPLLIYAMCRVPVRLSMLTLMFFVFALPNPAEGLPTKWTPPFYPLGGILLNHLNTVDRSIDFLAALPVSGLDIILCVLGLVVLFRRTSGSKVDSAGRAATPKPLMRLALLSIASTAFAWLTGLLRGGDFGMSLWQVVGVAYLPLVFLLFQEGLRGPKDHAALAKVLLTAVTYKCILAVYVVNTFTVPMNPLTGSTRPPYATAHNDSMLFAVAFVLILAPLIEGLGRRAKWVRWSAIVFLPILVAGTMANNRRLAWVQVALVYLTVYLVSRDSPIKRKIRRLTLIAAPLIAIYLNAGWDSQFGSLYKPARMMRSIVDPKSDGSTEWRELENVDLIATFRKNPLFGAGFGHPYEELVVLPAVDYSLEKYSPHNSLLGLWCYIGMIGYVGTTLLWMGGVYFAMRVYYRVSDAYHRVAALVGFGTVLVYLLQAWGDLGLGSTSGVFLMGSALAATGKLATATGQWVEGSPKIRSFPETNSQAGA